MPPVYQVFGQVVPPSILGIETKPARVFHTQSSWTFAPIDVRRNGFGAGLRPKTPGLR